jgi:type I restriction enzyme S subunit
MTTAQPARVQDLWLTDGDIFVERANTVEMVGLAALYRGPVDLAIFPDLLIRVRVQSHQLIPDILVEWLLLAWCRRYFQQHCRGAATNMPKIDHQTVEKLLVPLPPPEEQKLMLRLIRAIDERLSAESQRVKASQSLFSSMLHLLMSGQVRVNGLSSAAN